MIFCVATGWDLPREWFEPAGERCVTKDLLGRPLPSTGIVATIDFFGLTNSTCALASAAAKLPIELLDCCI